VIDHITSSSGMILPLARIVAACHARGVPVLVDGAHGPGQVGLDLAALGADWYVGNCHKWLMSAKGCGFLWARRDRQAGIHPAVISHGYGQGFLAYLSVTAALDFHTRLGGTALQTRNAALAYAAGNRVAARLGTETGTGNEPCGAMAMVRLPLNGDISAARATALRDRLLEAGTDVPLHAHASGIWLRLSAQAYNEADDYEQLADIVQGVLPPNA
jgi:isopenicillin-N epimerase